MEIMSRHLFNFLVGILSGLVYFFLYLTNTYLADSQEIITSATFPIFFLPAVFCAFLYLLIRRFQSGIAGKQDLKEKTALLFLFLFLITLIYYALWRVVSWEIIQYPVYVFGGVAFFLFSRFILNVSSLYALTLSLFSGLLFYLLFYILQVCIS